MDVHFYHQPDGNHFYSEGDPTTMETDASSPVVRRANETEYESVAAADGLAKCVLLAESDGMPTFAMRRFTLDPGAVVPKHVNEVEHGQYVLEGSYIVGIDDEEYQVTSGDSLYIPAGTVHWYRNDAATSGAFLCIVPNGNDEIQIVETDEV